MRELKKSFTAMALLLVLGLLTQFLQAQEVFRGIEINSSAEDRVLLNEGFQSYSLFELDHEALYELVDANREQAIFTLQIAGFDWPIELYENELRSPGYSAGQTGDDGYKEVIQGECVTFAGYLAQTSKAVRLNLEPNRVWGYVTTENGEYFIEPLNRFIDDAKEGEYILYNADDVIVSGEVSCGADTQSEKVKKSQPSQGAPKTGDDCRKLEIATESDFEAFNAGITFSDIIANLNLVEGIYTATYDVEIFVVYQHEWTTSADPYTTTESGCGGFGTLQQVGAEWRTNFTNIRRDMTVLYSQKDFNSNTIGCAWIGVFGNGSENDGVLNGEGTTVGPYSVNQWDWQGGSTSDASRRTLVAHEMGHNFGGTHDSNGGCANIMCPTINTTTVFNAAAQTQMNGNMNFESAVANDGRSALRERYLSAEEGGVSLAFLPSTNSANVLILDGTLIPLSFFFGTTAQYNASEEIRMNPGALMEAGVDINFQFDIASCANGAIVPNAQDGSGSGSDSEQLTSLNRGSSDTDVILYPNPTSSNSFIKLESEKEEQIFITIFDGLGRVVVQSNEFLAEGVNVIELQSENLTQGLYFVNLRIAEGESKTLKLQKID
ncbi:zinc-dependent metalloprotease [Cryomorphaceae bacterium 1068]|nr:zinc-dependent metalloprotease [Cryomorphaceae bacterium 1068]